MELQSLKLFLMSKFGVERIDALFWEIQLIILRSLLAVQHVMINDKHCFELYGKSLHSVRVILFHLTFKSLSWI